MTGGRGLTRGGGASSTISMSFSPAPIPLQTWCLAGEVEDLLEAARLAAEPPRAAGDHPAGYVSNARNAASRSDGFPFWGPAERTALGVGSLVRHSAIDPALGRPVDTYGLVIAANAQTLGLEDFAIHVYEEDARPPLNSIQPAPSR